MKRKSLGMWAWSAFSPMKARPEELTFDLLDEGERSIGQLVCTKFEMKLGGTKFSVSTPWGEGRITFKMDGPRVYLNDRELVFVKMYMLKGKTDFVFPNGKTIEFLRVKGKRNDIVHDGPDGFVGFYEEEGTLPEGASRRPIPLTREEIKAMPKDNRPRSIETNDYVQYRIKVGGSLPAPEEDIARGFCIFATFARLMDEMPA